MNALPVWQMVHPATFIQNPLIAKMANDKKWTLSDNKKIPIDARSYKNSNTILPAKVTNDSSYNPLVTLTELDNDPNLQAVNRAYRLQARVNRIIVIDIEPEAPIEMKLNSLGFPAHFTEQSRNGGIHLLIQVPESLINDSNRYMFDNLSVFKEPVPKPVNPNEKQRPAHYEVLFNDHFITFTKKMDTIKPCADFENNPIQRKQLEDFLAMIVELDTERKKQRELMKENRIKMISTSLNETTLENIQQFIGIEAMQVEIESLKQKTAEHFGNDNSKYEISIANKAARHTIRTLNQAKQTISFRTLANTFDSKSTIFIIYEILKDVLPYRNKHDEEREHMPWLLYIAKDAYEYILAMQKTKK